MKGLRVLWEDSTHTFDDYLVSLSDEGPIFDYEGHYELLESICHKLVTDKTTTAIGFGISFCNY